MSTKCAYAHLIRAKCANIDLTIVSKFADVNLIAAKSYVCENVGLESSKCATVDLISAKCANVELITAKCTNAVKMLT